jgi:rRNA processing protein Gar1
MLRKAGKNPGASSRPTLLGKALHVVNRGFVVKAVNSPKLGRPVFDLKKRRVGNVIDIFGPVKAPYVLIKPASGLTAEEQRSLLGSDIYMGEIRGKTKS